MERGVDEEHGHTGTCSAAANESFALSDTDDMWGDGANHRRDQPFLFLSDGNRDRDVLRDGERVGRTLCVSGHAGS
jgi:hypothetical protein